MNKIRKPNMFIVGEGTSGTTALGFQLKQHPDIYFSEPKELYYFCKDYHEESDKFHKQRLFFNIRNEEKYLSFFSDAKNEKIIAEGTAAYFGSTIAAKEIYKFKRDAKIIIHLRNPVDYISSYHAALYKRGYEKIGDIKTAIEMEERRVSGYDIPKSIIVPSYLYYKKHLDYYTKLKRYWDLFPHENIFINIYEDYKSDNQKTLNNVTDFLGIDRFSPDIKQNINSFSQPYSKFLNNLVFNRFSRAFFAKILSAKFYSKTGTTMSMIMNKKAIKEMPDENSKQYIRELSKGSVRQLSDLIRIDLISKWEYK